MTQENQVAQPEQSALVEVSDLDVFVRAISGWHGNKIELLNHMLNVPVGSEVEVGETKYVLDGDFLQGFRIGLHVALHELGELPFVVEMKDEQEEPGFDLPGTPPPAAEQPVAEASAG